MRLLALILACSFLTGSAGICQESPIRVSVIELLANPEKFDGKLVTLQGYLLVLGGQHDIAAYSLYLHREDAENQLGNSVQIVPNDQMQKDREKIDRMYVTLTGSVRGGHGANGSYIAVIKDVRTCGVWSDPTHPIGLKEDARRKNK